MALLATLDELKARMNMQPVGPPEPGGPTVPPSGEDANLLALLRAASESVANETGREFMPTPADDEPAETRVASAFHSTFCQAFDLRAVESIVADGTDLTSGTRLVRMRPSWPAHALRLPVIVNQVEITGWFGWLEVPDPIREATLSWAQRAYHEAGARMSDAVEGPGGIMTYFRQVPASIAVTLDRYRVGGL